MGPQVLAAHAADCTIAFLPSAHIAQRVVIELLPIRMGIPVWFSESLAKLPHEMKTIRPTFLLAPPRVWERIFTSVNTEIKKKSAAARKMFHGAVGLGAEVSRLREEGKPVPKTMLGVAQNRRPAGVLERSASVWAAVFASQPRARRRSARTWRASTRPSACRSSKATASPRAASSV